MTTPAHLEPTDDDRGLVRLPAIPDAFGGWVQVRESSADEPMLWLDAVARSLGRRDDAAIHLTAEDAWRLADQLRCAVENHYQGDARPEWALPPLHRPIPEGRAEPIS